MLDQISMNEAKRLIKQTPPKMRKKGCAAHYIPCGLGVGLKLYQRKIERNYTYKMQKKAWGIGLAPAVGRKFHITDTDKWGFSTCEYGYFTESVETFAERFCSKYEISYQDWMDDIYPDEVKDEEKRVEEDLENCHEFNKLMSGLKSIGISTDDMHWGNFGYLPDGRMVAIDFYAGERLS